MTYSRDELGLIETVMERLEKFHLPRLLELEDRVGTGAILTEFDIQFLEEAMNDTREIEGFVDKHEEFQSIFTRIVQLYETITEKALQNEKQPR